MGLPDNAFSYGIGVTVLLVALVWFVLGKVVPRQTVDDQTQGYKDQIAGLKEQIVSLRAELAEERKGRAEDEKTIRAECAAQIAALRAECSAQLAAERAEKLKWEDTALTVYQTLVQLPEVGKLILPLLKRKGE